jgi:hypothetical protein
MAKTHDIQRKDLLKWDSYMKGSAQESLEEMYGHASSLSQDTRNWYWASIRNKRMASQIMRWLAFLLLLAGTVMPLLAGLSDVAAARLQCTQVGIVMLAVAGLLLYADKAFGWSSGWLRYVTTILAMENRTRKFELEWANYMVGKTAAISADDVKALFAIAKQFEEDLAKLQSDETDKWVAEFNSGLALMGEIIKSQRETIEKTAETARTAVDVQKQKAEAEAKANLDGNIEVSITYKAPEAAKPINIGLDGEAKQLFFGSSWARLNVKPGQHQVSVETTGQPAKRIEKVVVVSPGSAAKAEIAIE